MRQPRKFEADERCYLINFLIVQRSSEGFAMKKTDMRKLDYRERVVLSLFAGRERLTLS